MDVKITFNDLTVTGANALNNVTIKLLKGEKGDTGNPTSAQVNTAVTDYFTAHPSAARPSDAQVENAVTDWLDDHPEATTTVQDGSITESKLSSELIDKINSGGVSPLKTVNMGEVFAQPENYLAWFQGTMKYDNDIECPVAVISGKDAHTTGSGKCYFFKIEPKTGEVSLSVAGQYDDADTYGCFSQSFYIDNNGNYNFYASIHQSSGWTQVSARKYTSTDKGATWTYTDVTGTTIPTGSIILLSNGRLLGLTNNGSGTRNQAIYSDDDGATWTKGSVFSGSTEVEIIELENTLIAIGRKALTYNAPLPAVLYYSSNNGGTWSSGVDSTTITDMCNPCSGVYWANDKMLELFYCSRAARNGNTGTIYHAYALLDDALNDNFTVEEIGESKQTSVGIDFGYCSTACDQKDSAWVIYYDKADSGSGVNLNLILANKTCVTLPVSDSTTGLINLWTASKIEQMLQAQYKTLNTKINEIIIQGGGTIVDELDGSLYVTDKLYCNYDFTDDTKYDASTSEWSPKVGQGTAFVAKAYNDMSGVGDEKPSGSSGQAYIDMSTFSSSGDWSLEIYRLNTTSSSSNATYFSLMTQVNFYNGKKLSAIYSQINGDYTGTQWYGKNINDGTTHHLVLVYSSEDNALYFYDNNVLLKTISNPTNTPVMTSYIGILAGNAYALRVYSKALSVAEINNNYIYTTSD